MPVPGHESRGLGAPTALREAFVLLHERQSKVLTNHGLTILQFDALRVLAEGTGLRMGQLASRLLCDDSTLGRAVAGLVDASLVERTADAADRRASVIVLSAIGEERFSSAVAAIRHDAEKTFGALADDDESELERILVLLVERFAKADLDR